YKLGKASYMDPLTQIYNRRGLERKVRAGEASYEQSDHMAVIMMDIDKFKQYNDYYGHDVGDVCLENVGGIFPQILDGEAEIYARYGGEEFIAVFFGKTNEYVYECAERIRSGIEALQMEHVNQPNRKHVTLSLGVHCASVKEGFEKVLKLADENLYEAKRKGGNAVV
ncbi:GGDEF domain-containing protein, partial [Lachnospiraceae bacterium OttesenSCG-928-D06]|nr:GGDEF domain-containing protein [Lachnospiraceae bacterium OttesenSCG-928-D06]